MEAEVLQRVRNATPAFLEHVAVHLMLAMGYGGGNSEMGRVTGGSGDGGIDGIVVEDVLGMDKIFLQAKKYGEGNTVGGADLQRFVGAIDAQGGAKGVFVTTSSFTRAAMDFIARSQKRIVLIDGPKLGQLMVQHGVGVRTQRSHKIKAIDDDFFDQET